MDYYRILKIARGASPKEVEQAYQRLMKESRYNSSIDRKAIETAYRILSDKASRRMFDAKQKQQGPQGQKVEKKSRKSGKGIGNKLKKITRAHLLKTLGILILIAVAFYFFRFGHLVKHFQAGDVLYFKDSEQKMGKIVRVEPQYDFGSASLPAYLIETEGDRNQVWLPQTDVKSRCYKKELTTGN